MKENYYDILEISKSASPEIIEKAYRTLTKKYHPDLCENNLKIKHEEKMKKINEAYEILSNLEKRKKYDLFLKNNEISIEDYNKLYNENINLKNEINYLKNNYCINDYKKNYSNKYKIKFTKIKKDLLALLITIIILIIIFFILWNIPFTRNYLIDLYNNNSILKIFVDLILDIFK